MFKEYSFRTLSQDDEIFVAGLFQNKQVMKDIGPVLSANQAGKLFSKMLTETMLKHAIYQLIVSFDHKILIGLVSMHWNKQEESIESGMMLLPEFQNMGICKWAQLKAMRLAKTIYPVKFCSIYIGKHNISANTSIAGLGFELIENVSKRKKHKNLNLWNFNLDLI